MIVIKEGIYMKPYILSCCSTVDLTHEHLANREIEYTCFHYQLGKDEYVDDLYQSLSAKEFYKAMVDGADTKTSQVNVSEYIDYFTKLLEK